MCISHTVAVKLWVTPLFCTPFNKGSLCPNRAQMDTHAETKTKKGPNRSLSWTFFFVLSRSASSHTGLGGGYLRPHGAGRVQNRACVMLDKIGRLNPWSYREEQIAVDGTAYLCLNYEFVVRYIWFRVRKNLLLCDAHVSLLLVSLEIPCAKCIHKTPRCFNDIKHQKIYN